MLREVENIGVVSQSNKLMENEPRSVVKKKLNALSDLKNTLHSRSTFINENVTVKTKETPASKFSDKKPLLGKNFQSAKKSVVREKNLLSPESDWFEDFHDHAFCEEAEETCQLNFLNEFKLTNEEIDKLAKFGRMYKPVRDYVLTTPAGPVDDIFVNIFDVKQDNFIIEDIFSDLVIPNVPPPVKAL